MYWENVFTQIADGARLKGELTDDEYRELILTDDITDRLDKLVDILREKKLAQLVKGAEFIESITPADPRYNRAIEKYNKISESLEYERINININPIPSLYDIYKAMCECYINHNRIMKYEELRKKFPNHSIKQIEWGMMEFNQQITPFN